MQDNGLFRRLACITKIRDLLDYIQLLVLFGARRIVRVGISADLAFDTLNPSTVAVLAFGKF